MKEIKDDEKYAMLGMKKETVDFTKGMNGLIPTIVTDRLGTTLMLAYSNVESLAKTRQTGYATYYSRRRKELWVKGETSGNRQRIVRIGSDCDNDTLLFVVEQEGPCSENGKRQEGVACHNGTYSCFPSTVWTLETLRQTLGKKIGSDEESSYTRKIANDKPQKLKKKIMEEAFEVCDSTTKDERIWEIADLFYFVTVLMAKDGISYDDVMKELQRREK